MLMRIYLGLGSNLGDRRSNLFQALELLKERALTITRVSPVVESPALLLENSPADWDRPFLNLALQCETKYKPEIVYGWIKEIEQNLERVSGPCWAPRPIDIDILTWGDNEVSTKILTIPHTELRKRNFVLTPLIALEPRLRPPGVIDETLLESSQKLLTHIPLWMGIINVTPDSFSDGARFLDWKTVEPQVRGMIDAGAHIIDVGGESTRPGATMLTADKEWSRINTILELLLEARQDYTFGPLISVDTYHVKTARKALELGIDIVNDVGGLCLPEMIELAKTSAVDWIAMHQLSLPANPKVTLPEDVDPYDAVEQWLLKRIDVWDKAGLDLNRIIFDPGIGFGKTARQSLELLSRAGDFRRHGLRVLVGHSRKSFLNLAVGDTVTDRNQATVNLSMKLCDQGVDILRVHDVPMNINAYRTRSHTATDRPSNSRQ